MKNFDEIMARAEQKLNSLFGNLQESFGEFVEKGKKPTVTANEFETASGEETAPEAGYKDEKADKTAPEYKSKDKNTTQVEPPKGGKGVKLDTDSMKYKSKDKNCDTTEAPKSEKDKKAADYDGPNKASKLAKESFSGFSASGDKVEVAGFDAEKEEAGFNKPGVDKKDTKAMEYTNKHKDNHAPDSEKEAPEKKQDTKAAEYKSKDKNTTSAEAAPEKKQDVKVFKYDGKNKFKESVDAKKAEVETEEGSEDEKKEDEGKECETEGKEGFKAKKSIPGNNPTGKRFNPEQKARPAGAKADPKAI